MPRAHANGLELEYDTFGRPDDPLLLLVMGLGAQLIVWDPAFCDLLAAEGFHVVRFDNRDVGLSSYLDNLPLPDLAAITAGDRTTVPYVLSDMAADAAGLLDALGADRAHVVGQSMGGMIAQQLVIDHPERVLSLCSIMSTTGDMSVGQPTPEALQALLAPPATTREERIAQSLTAHRITGSPGFPPDGELPAKIAARFDRAFHPAGSQRQTAAVVASPDRTAALGSVTVPTVVIHGEADPLVNVSGGKATAAAIPGAELVLIPGMGHDLPKGAWPTVVDAITRNARRA